MTTGRIIKGIGGIYTIATENGIYECSARGIFRKNKITPTVGDYVEIKILNEDTKKGSIEKINERRNIMLRPRVANIDCAVITFAAISPAINRDLLDRFLILAQHEKIDETIICINKCDLAEDKSEIEELEKIYSPMYRILFVSAEKGIGIENLKECLKGKVSVLAGPSGVGKSSLINCLIPEKKQRTGEISQKIERGKHTTRQVELLDAGIEDTYIMDSPGFTSLMLDFMEESDLKYYFKEFAPYLDGCRFNDCRHINEPDCELKAHVGKEISKERYDRFLRLYNEIKESKN